MTVYTPGPWNVELQEYAAVITYNNGSIAAVYPSDLLGNNHDRDANARLMAAAPDLLAALQGILNCRYAPGSEDQRDVWAEARAAIAKATVS